MRKKLVIKKRFFFFLLLIFLIVFGAKYIYRTIQKENERKSELQEISLDENYLSIFSNRIYLVYGSRLIIECNTNVNIKKNLPISRLLEQENYSKLLVLINSVMPEKLDSYVLGKEIDQTMIVTEMPTVDVDNGKYISSVDVNNLFDDSYYKTPEIKKNKLIIDFFNGTGDTDYSNRVAKYINKKFGYIMNTAENDKKMQYTYINNIDAEDEDVKMVVRALREKYIKMGTAAQMNTMAKIVIILGDDKVKDFKIKVFSQNGASVHMSKLKARGYSGIEKIRTNKLPSEDKIVYNGEDYYTAVKLSELLDINNLEEDNQKSNSIEVYITGGE